MSLDRILIVDDEPLMRNFLSETIARLEKYDFDVVSNGKEALGQLEKKEYDLIFSDMKMPELDGMGLLNHVKNKYPNIIIVMMTAFGTIETAVAAMKKGAYDYIMKPVSPDEIEVIISKVESLDTLIKENEYLKTEINKGYNIGQIVSDSPKMKAVLKDIDVVAKSKSTVLIRGESGTGKELAARAIHYKSVRANKPFIKVNCAALSETLLESEMFGHEKGAFTGAINKRVGRFELADTGTLLLDEISEIPIQLQAKLLRILQEREFERVGGNKTIKFDVRIIATTNRDLEECIKTGKFREDLFYRLNVIPIEIVPLRERKKDIDVLVKYFLEKYNIENNKNIKSVSKTAMNIINSYDWPGNVRELENIIQRAVVMCQKNIIDEELIYINNNIEKKEERSFSNRALKDIEREVIFDTLKDNNNNKTKASKVLGITVRTLRNKLNEYKNQ